MTARTLETHPIHLGKGATAEPQPEFPRDARAMQWYMDYGARHAADGTEGRLVSMYRFTEAEGVFITAGVGTEHRPR